jgi:galactose mutarotase-like enzyme
VEDRRGEGLSAGALELAAGDALARIAPLGAEAVSWRVGGRDLLWTRSTGHWDRVAPILFPCVGWSRGGAVTIDGARFPMPVHGFAAACHFHLLERTEDSASFELASSDETRAHYPFAFRLRASYALTPRALRMELRAQNDGDAPMPYACGFHPGLSWPFAGGVQHEHQIRFEDDELPQVPVITADGLFSHAMRAVPLDARRLPLSPGLFEREALCFLDARSRGVRFEGPGGVIAAQAEGFRHWALWSRPGAPFLCVEAWTGHGDPEGFSGEFRDKPSIDMLAPGEVRTHALTLHFMET